MSAEDIARVVGAKYAPGDADAADEPAEDAQALKCSGDALRAIKANDRKGFLEAVRAMTGDYEESAEEG